MKWQKEIADGVPIKSWCENIEAKAMEQACALAKLPFAYHHVSLMPDCHAGVGMPIGGVLATKGIVVPNAVGVDIGCGMIALQMEYLAGLMEVSNIRRIMDIVRREIPVGFAHQVNVQKWSGFDSAPTHIPIIAQELDASRKQLGTLGGGNHFIEMQYGDDGKVWLMIHSGSRNFGLKIAQVYDKIAREMSPTGHRELCGLPVDSKEGLEYLQAMDFALKFAFENRRHMMDIFAESFRSVINCWPGRCVNIHHNYAAEETHFGERVWVHRKGATSARLGEKGIIPGSMGTSSYLVEGLGNPESFNSCSHGAGRCMGRGFANKNLKLEDCQKAMEGIVFEGFKAEKGKVQVDEAPQAYKNIDEVIASEQDLVKVLVKLTPVGVVKG